MTETKYGNNIVTQMKKDFIPNYFAPSARRADAVYPKSLRLAYLDDEVIKGGFYVENVWFFKGSDEISVYPHKHDYDEVLTFFGSNSEDPYNLNGEIELWLEDEKHVLTKSCLVFIPKGMKHCPLIIRRVDRPIFHYATGAASIYHGEKLS